MTTEPIDLDAIETDLNDSAAAAYIQRLVKDEAEKAGALSALGRATAALPALLARVRTTEASALSYMQMHVGIVNAVMDELGVKGDDDPLPDDLAACECQGEGGTRHLIWHLGQRASRTVEAAEEWEYYGFKRRRVTAARGPWEHNPAMPFPPACEKERNDHG